MRYLSVAVCEIKQQINKNYLQNISKRLCLPKECDILIRCSTIIFARWYAAESQSWLFTTFRIIFHNFQIIIIPLPYDYIFREQMNFLDLFWFVLLNMKLTLYTKLGLAAAAFWQFVWHMLWWVLSKPKQMSSLRRMTVYLRIINKYWNWRTTIKISLCNSVEIQKHTKIEWKL